ncbi:MAG: class I SAM-dependent methyltransferase [Gammaproteobacteria bacterium]|nr:class I SAM-dependent methyltransferase [Gammaproteobacteria bacterium]
MGEIFTIPHQPYVAGPKPNGHNERCIEVPWALSVIPDEGGTILDVGYAYSEGRWLHPLLEMSGLDLYGVDVAEPCPRHKNMLEKYKMTQIKHDIRFPMEAKYTDFFDVIFCVSTIEHLGYDNDWYFKPSDTPYESTPIDDKIALRNMMAVLKHGGKLALTVPYGKYEEKRHFRQYDRLRLSTLIKPYKIDRYDLFYYDGTGWRPATEEQCANKHYGHYGFVSSSALACILLTK